MSDMQNRINKAREQNAQQQAKAREIAWTVARFLQIMKQNGDPGSITVRHGNWWASCRGWVVSTTFVPRVVAGKMFHDRSYVVLLDNGKLAHYQISYNTFPSIYPENGGAISLHDSLREFEGMPLASFYDAIMEFIPYHFAKHGLDWTDK